MSNWADNPENKRKSLMSYALPSLLFNECQRLCINDDFTGAVNEGQRTCLNNCQDKTYRAFELYMAVQSRVAQRRNFRHYVDISKYTGMEVEHSHDTESQIPTSTGSHIHPQMIQPFQ